jgi:hypothetical protein
MQSALGLNILLGNPSDTLQGRGGLKMSTQTATKHLKLKPCSKTKRSRPKLASR